MPRVVLPSHLASRLATPESLEVPGGTAAEVLSRLEAAHPALAGWVLDERGRLRRHVHLFRGSEQVTLDAPLAAGEELVVVTAISGGEGEGAGDAGGGDAELLVGTKKGLLVLRGRPGEAMAVAGRAFPGEAVEHAVRDPRSGRAFAAVTNGFFGPRIYFTDGDATGTWHQAEDGPAFPEDTGAAVDRIWAVEPGEEPGTLWAGVAPAALFASRDDGLTWRLVRGLWDQPGRAEWQGGAGGLCLHSICPWPGEPGRLAVGISAAGVWRTEDGGESWSWGVDGLVPRYVPEEARATTTSFCVHKLRRVAAEPRRLWMQFHGGVYRSEDAGASWLAVGEGLPSDFGFPLAADPEDPARAWVIPLVADVDRVTPEGRLRVYETLDGGATWRPHERGLPQRDAYLTILRQAFDLAPGGGRRLAFGTTTGEVFASPDGGSSWGLAAEHLPPVASVRFAGGAV